MTLIVVDADLSSRIGYYSRTLSRFAIEPAHCRDFLVVTGLHNPDTLTRDLEKNGTICRRLGNCPEILEGTRRIGAERTSVLSSAKCPTFT